MPAYPAHHGLYLPVAVGRWLRCEDDQQAQEVRVVLKRAGGDPPAVLTAALGQILGRRRLAQAGSAGS